MTGARATMELPEWVARQNHTRRDWPDGAAVVHVLFEQQVERTPTATALVEAELRLDYRQLNQRANQLAVHLRALGAGPDRGVAIYLDRGIDMIVSLLAVLKSGAAYVPLDPAYPAERLAYTVTDSQPVVLLTRAGMEKSWETVLGELPAGTRVVDLRAVEHELATLPEANPSVEALGLTSGHLAYVLYTSGSTGQPKGVAMPHGPLVNLIQWQVREEGNELPLRTLQFAALGFDVAFQETFATLCTGGELHLIDQDSRLSPGKLFDFVLRHRIERIFVPYFALQMLAEGMDAHVERHPEAPFDCALRQVITAGEQLRIDPGLARMFARLPGCRLHNHYGPTESHVVTALTLPADSAAWERLPSIGRPIANARIYLLDEQGQAVDVGEEGELFLAGPVLARGYLQRPELSAERFLPDPFDDGDDARMYRTGDLGRWNADGSIEFLGRKDFQVKIRGFRVELGEIEARLMAFPGIRQAGVLAREDVPGLKRLVAYVAPLQVGSRIDIEALRRALVEVLPDYMIPAAFMQLDELPLSPNGKLERTALPAPGRERPDWMGEYQPPRGELETRLCGILAEVLDLEKLGRDDNFFDLGGTSLLAARVLENIRRQGLGDAAAVALFNHPTAALLARTLSGPTASVAAVAGTARRNHAGPDDPIAIVGMAGRFPGANTVEQFWDNLCAGRDTVDRFTLDELDPAIAQALRRDPSYVPARGILEDYDKFDAAFFGISPREAELMDPQQRLFLELCWECMERAGHAPDSSTVPVGVFAGMYNASYYQRHVLAHPELVDSLGAFQVMLGNEKDYIATRIAHKLNLTGPAISVHTACSTSLVAICQAVDSLRAGRCDMALAGGIAITCPVRSGHLYQEGAMFSPDGHTRAFDAQAGGTVFSDGAAVLLLKRLSDAIADGNPVHAVIRGVAVNNDGAGKASFTAPSSDGQAAVIAQAHADAGIAAGTIGYVEAHGTATPLGDPIEVEGLCKAFAIDTAAIGPCVLGSVKSNVGHILMAAGAAGVIKSALALETGTIPGTVHFEQANPVLGLAQTPFVVDARARAWPEPAAHPRRAGVSSFGVGGTNAHVVLEQAPSLPASEAAQGPQLLVVSARTPDSLQHAVSRLAVHLQDHPEANLADVAWTLAAGRKAMAHRMSLVAETVAQAASGLASDDTKAAVGNSRPAHAREVVFLFPGQGCHYQGMGQALYAGEPVFRDAVDACADMLAPLLQQDIRGLMFGEDVDALLPTAIMQPAIFTIEYALAQWWMAQGIRPAAMIGHSVGEFVAATLAGVFSLGDALRLVARRGALMQARPSGAMLSVRLPLAKLQPYLLDATGVELAAENSPAACVVAGSHDAVAAVQARLEQDAVACRLLKTSHAFHSEMMAAAVAPFQAEVAKLALRGPEIPIMSTATGEWLTDAEAMAAGYWASHLRQPVRFSPALARLLEVGPRVLLEVGPRNTLQQLSRQQPAFRQQHLHAVASLSDNAGDEPTALRSAVGQLWCAGVELDLASFDRRQRRRRMQLPSYPFERKRHWVEGLDANAHPVVVPHPAATHRPAMENAMPAIPAVVPAPDRKPALAHQLREIFEDVAGFELTEADAGSNFIELGLDSLTLTQVALKLQKTFQVKITFRQLMSDYSSLTQLAAALDGMLPADPQPVPAAMPPATFAPAGGQASAASASAVPLPPMPQATSLPAASGLPAADVRGIIEQQMQLMARQLALLAGVPATEGAPVASPTPQPAPPVVASAAPASAAPASAVASATAADAPDAEAAALAHVRYDVKKAFGAIARIDSGHGSALEPLQQDRLDGFIQRYLARTGKSREYTRQHRPHMADPRVVTGFRPLTKEIVYQIVIERSRGSHLWDIDGNEYVDALNGFGTSLFGWQPDFVTDAVRKQLEQGYEIGPQHPLAGEVAQLVCELTGHERAALCNTGSEAVLGAMRIARTVTGRDTIVMFSGSYHGINDEVIARGTRKLRSVPAAPGILPNMMEKVLVLDYGTDETLQIIRERAGELAAVLVEPVQSRRPDFQPVEFLKQVREITAGSGTVLIFDEVITGFRSHPGGAQALFGIRADLATYGKVVGGGYPIGVMAGKRQFMDALDGGQWEYGDESVPTVGVTYFAGTFVRHPLTLAAAKASLLEMKRQGEAMQARLNQRTAEMAAEINAFCEEQGAPIRIKHFASLWRTHFEEDHLLQDLLFAMMRSRGIHILDNFPCFFTTAHTEADFRAIIDAYKASVLELLESRFVPRRAVTSRTVMDAEAPAVPGARLGRDPDGRPAWYVADPDAPGQYVKVSA